MSRKEENTGCEQLTILLGRVPDVLSHWDTESKGERYVAVASRAKKEEDDEERVGVGQPGFALVVRMSRIPVFSRNLTGSCFCYQATRYYVSPLYASNSTLDQANPSDMMQDRVQVGKLIERFYKWSTARPCFCSSWTIFGLTRRLIQSLTSQAKKHIS